MGAPLGCFPLKNNIQGAIESWRDPVGADIPPKPEQSSAALSATGHGTVLDPMWVAEEKGPQK